MAEDWSEIALRRGPIETVSDFATPEVEIG